MRLPELGTFLTLRLVQVVAVERRAIVHVDPQGVCPTVPTVSVILQPVYCTAPAAASIKADPLGSERLAASSSISLCPLTTITTTLYPDYATTVSKLSTTTVTTTPLPSTASLFIGQGLPSGTVTDSGGDFLFLAFIASPIASPVVSKRAVGAGQGSTVSALTLVDLVVPNGVPDGTDQDDCDSSSPLLLQGGQLLQSGNAVAKYNEQNTDLFGFLLDPPGNQINVSFALTNGVLAWTMPDAGLADFYNCDGGIYVGFGPPMDGCIRIVVGAIAGTACLDRVRSTRAPNPTFTAPTADSTALSTSGTASASETMLSSSGSMSISSLTQAAQSSGTMPIKSPSASSTTVQVSTAAAISADSIDSSSTPRTIPSTTLPTIQPSPSKSSPLGDSITSTTSSAVSSATQSTSTTLAPPSSTFTTTSTLPSTTLQSSTSINTNTTSSSPIPARQQLTPFSATGCSSGALSPLVATENQCLAPFDGMTTIRSVQVGSFLDTNPSACYKLAFFADASCGEPFRYFSIDPRTNEGACMSFPAMGLQGLMLMRC